MPTKEDTPLIDVSAKSPTAYSPTYFADAADGLYKTVQHWYDAYNGGSLAVQPIRRLLELSNCTHFHELMKALNIPSEYTREFRKNLLHFNGTLNDFVIFYKNNPELFQTEKYFAPVTRKRSRRVVPQNDNKESKSSLRDWFKKAYYTVADKLANWFTFDNSTDFGISAKKARILAYKAEYFRKHHRAWRNVAISLPFLSMWTWGYHHVNGDTSPVNDNVAPSTVVVKYNPATKQITPSQKCATIDLSKAPSSLSNLAHNATKTVYKFFNQSVPCQHSSSYFSSLPTFTWQQNEYTKQLMAQKDKDMEDFAKLYRQCSYNNYVKLSNGYKKETFKAANRSLKNHGIKPLHPSLYCAGMSIASLCQAQDIFKQKRPDSYLIPAIDEILKNCHNVHHSATLKKDLKKMTHSYSYSSDPTYDIENYMQTHKNAIIFLWTPRGGGNFHHQTFFQTKASDNLYTYSSFNRQRWGNQDDFKDFLNSKRHKNCYFTDFSEGLDNIATKYIERDAKKHMLDLAQVSLPTMSQWVQNSRA